MIKLNIRRLAERDADAIVDYYLVTAGIDAAVRFQDALRHALDRLVERPHIGSTVKIFKANLSGVRFWPIPSFEHYLVFYLPSPDMIDVIHIFHGARDLAVFLNEDDFL